MLISRLFTSFLLMQLPVLETEGGFLQRANAIIRYLASLRTDIALLGSSEFEAAEVDQWLDFVLSEVDVRAEVAVKGGPRGELSTVLSRLDGVLSGRTYLVGERLSAADVALVVPIHTVVGTVMPASALTSRVPHLYRWYRTVMSNGAVSQVLGSASSGVESGAEVSEFSGSVAAVGGGGSVGPAVSGVVDAADVARGTAGARCGMLSLREERFQRRRLRLAELFARGESMDGERVTVCGWVRTVRKQKGLLFVALNDGSCQNTVQIVVEREGFAGGEDQVADLERNAGVGAALRVEGKVVKSPKPGQPVEVSADAVFVVGPSDAKTYPIAKGKGGVPVEVLRDHQQFRPRTNLISAVARVRNCLAFAVHRFYQERGFYYVHTPLISTSDCEGAGEMFAVTTLLPKDAKGDLPRTPDGAIDYSKDFFHKPAGLTVSGQLQVEAFCCSMSDVYTFGPTFRAELSHTSRHLSEFWMIEPEIAFADLNDNMDLAEDFTKYLTAYALEHCPEELAFFDKFVEKGLLERLRHVVDSPFERITYAEAMRILSDPKTLRKAKFETKPQHGDDLATEHERWLTEQVFQKPVFVTNWPAAIKAFYMRADDGADTVAAMDLLVPRVGELIGGSQREERFDVLRERMASAGVPEESIKWYLDLREYGTCPHAGFGLGFERLIMYVTGISNIRDVIPFPRGPGRADV